MGEITEFQKSIKKSMKILSKKGDYILIKDTDANHVIESLEFMLKSIEELNKCINSEPNAAKRRVFRLRKDMEALLEEQLNWDNSPASYDKLQKWIRILKKVEGAK